MKQEIIKAEDFGLTPKDGNQIQKEFAVVTTEQSGLIEVYDTILKSEITPSLEEEARKLSTKLSKLNATNNNIHKSQKAFYLAGGKFVDALKNKNKIIIAEMQERLSEIKNYSKNLRLAEIAKLEAQRIAELEKLESDIVPQNVGEMSLEAWEMYIKGVKLVYDTRIEEEQKAEQLRLATERIEKLHTDRKYKLSRLIDFIDDFDSIDFGTMTTKDFDKLSQEAISKRTAYEKEQESIRLENERLQKEAEAKAKKVEAEKLKAQKIADAKLRKEQEKAAKQQALINAKLEAARKEKAKLEAEIAKKKQAEAEEKRKAEAVIQAELRKGDSDKMNDFVKDLQNIKTKYSFKSKVFADKYESAKLLIDKIIVYIK